MKETNPRKAEKIISTLTVEKYVKNKNRYSGTGNITFRAVGLVQFSLTLMCALTSDSGGDSNSTGAPLHQNSHIIYDSRGLRLPNFEPFGSYFTGAIVNFCELFKRRRLCYRSSRRLL